MKILWISPFVPYDSVSHAGGQNHNYYLKYIKKNTPFDIDLVTVCDVFEVDKIDLNQYEINSYIGIYNKKDIFNIVRVLMGKVFIWRDGNLLNNAKYKLLLKEIGKYSKSGDKPDVIITQWTEATILINRLKKVFPYSRYIAIEEDVAFLGFQRKYESETGVKKLYRKFKYYFLKKAEINALSCSDLIVTLNNKDEEILENIEVLEKKLFRMSPYFTDYSSLDYSPKENCILFFGAMSRFENYSSVIWFIENVMPKIDEEIKLIVLGANPNPILREYESSRVEITGYVEDITYFLEKSLCLVAPLLYGAGIKIKILEAMSSGLPVLTNRIGCEGIEIIDGEHFLFCESVADYIEAINLLKNNIALRKQLSNNGKKFIKQNFNVDYTLEKLIERIKEYEQKDN